MAVEHKDAEGKSRAGEQMFQAVFMAMEEGAVLLNRSGEIVAANPAAENILGFAATELIGRSFSEFAQALNLINENATPLSREAHPAVLALQTGEAQRNVLMGAHRPDGRRVWLSVNAQPLVADGSREPYAVIKTFRDITAHKRTEDALRFIAQRGWMGGADNFFAALAQHLGAALDVDYVFIDRLGNEPDSAETVALYAKGAIAQNLRYALKGTPCENVMGRQFCLYPQGIRQRFPEDAMLEEMGAESYAGIPLWNSAGQPIGLIAVVGSKPIVDEEGIAGLLQLVAIRAAAELERERSERILRERERDFRTLTESSPDSIIRYDADGRMQYLNSGLLNFLGLNASDVIGKLPREVWTDGRYAAIEQAIARAMETGEVAIAEFSDVDATGRSRFHQVRVVPERDASGQIVGTVAFGQEVTAIREAERKLKHFIDSLPGFAFTFRVSPDAQPCFPYASAGIAELYGLSPDDVKNDFMPIHLLAHPDDRSRIDAGLVESARMLTPFRIESRICRPGLPERWQDVRSVPEREADGSTLWYGIMLDITERKQAEKFEQLRSHILELLSGNALLTDILEGIVRGIEQFHPGMICSILLLDSQGKRLGEGVAPSLPDFYNAAIDGLEIGIGAGCCGTAAASGNRVVVEDIQTHPYWAPYKDLATWAGLGACWSEPIRSSTGKVLGTFAIYHRETHLPDANEISLIEKTVHLASIAIERRQANEALRASEERMRLFFERQLVGMAITSPDKGWIHANDRICEMLGYPREELVQMSWAEVTHPDDLGPDVAQFEQMLNGEIDSYTVEKRYIRKDGGIVHAALSIGCVRKADGAVDYVLALVEDVTERKLTELARQADAHSLECMDRVNKAILGAADQEQMMSDVLDVVLDIFGCDRAFLLHPCDPDADALSVPMERTRPEYPGALARGGAIPMDSEAAEMMRILLNADGVVKFGQGVGHPLPRVVSEQFDIKSLMSMAVFPKPGKPWQFGIHQCCHARSWTRDEEALFEKIGWRLSDALTSLLMYRNLQASEREFRALAENLPDFLVRYDREGRRTYVNPALERLAVAGEQMVGKTLRESNPTGIQKPEIYLRALEYTLATGERSVFEIRFAPSDGKEITHLCFIAAERAADGQITGAIAVGRDITERKRNEAELERYRHHLEKLVEERTADLSIAKETAEAATRAKTRFLASASHDMRQPLQAIGLFNDALGMTVLDEKQKRISLNLSRSVQSLGQLLNQLLDISRLDAGIIEPKPMAIQSGDLLGMIGAEFDAVASEKDLSLNLFGPKEGLLLFSDSNLLMTLMRNLVSNAVKYTPRGGVLVGIRRRGDRALIQVWDTGIGIAPELVDSIFEEYFQADNPERDRAKGVGLGLAIVKRLSNLLDIGVSFHSREGKGTVFELRVPLAGASHRPASPISPFAAPETDAHARLAGRRIVVVEDDALAAEALIFTLENIGAQVTLYSTAEEALGSADAIGADYYISDLRLPGMNGLQLLDALQANSAAPIKAVLLTGNTSPDQIALTQSSRWNVLFKPVDMHKLLAAMEL